LDLACSTGFSSRYIARQIPASGIGIDLSAASIDVARANAKREGIEDSFSYICMDACDLKDLQGFTHVLAGCNFAFIQDREQALSEVSRVTHPQSYLCTANFHYHRNPPSLLLDQVQESLGWRPNPDWTMEYWSTFFGERYEIIHNEVRNLTVLEDEVLRNKTRSILFEKPGQVEKYGEETLSAIADRFYEVRRPLNDQRAYQGYSVQVWRKKQ